MLSFSKFGIDPLKMHGWLHNDVTLLTFVLPERKSGVMCFAHFDLAGDESLFSVRSNLGRVSHAVTN